MGTGDPWLLVQHVSFEGPGAIARAIAHTGAELTVVRTDRGDAIPPPAAVADMPLGNTTRIVVGVILANPTLPCPPVNYTFIEGGPTFAGGSPFVVGVSGSVLQVGLKAIVPGSLLDPDRLEVSVVN